MAQIREGDEPMDKKFAKNVLELIAPYRSNRKNEKMLDGRKLHPYCGYWAIERMLACLQNYH